MEEKNSYENVIAKNVQTTSLVSAAFNAIVENTKDIMFVKNTDLVYVAASMAFVKLTGRNRLDEVVGHTDEEIFEDKSLAKRYVTDDRELMAKGEGFKDYIEPIPDEGGHARYGSTSKYLLFDEDNNIMGILGITEDITREYITRQHYQQELQYLFKLPEGTLVVSYIDIDRWRIISQRRQHVEDGTLHECQTIQELIEAAVESIVDDECEAKKFYKNFSKESIKEIYGRGKNFLSFKYQRRLTDGSVKWINNEIRFRVDSDSGNLCAMLTAKDIDAEKKEEEDLFTAAKLDKMTMLLNRETTMESIREVLDEEIVNVHVLFMIDIDNFKKLNDTYGHQAGDEFLIAFAKEVKANFRETDIVGRIGGDEFFAFMRNVSGVSLAEKKAGELLATIQKVSVDYPDVELSGSIGVAMYPEDGKTLEDLYAMADGALYQAKRSGKNKFVFV